MGSPGAGKTTVGRLVAQSLGKQAIDVDNDHLEKVWNMTVAEKVGQYSDGIVSLVFGLIVPLWESPSHCIGLVSITKCHQSKPLNSQFLIHLSFIHSSIP